MIPIDLIERLWAAPALVTSGCSVAIILTTKWHGELTLDASHGVQKNHTTQHRASGNCHSPWPSCSISLPVRLSSKPFLASCFSEAFLHLPWACRRPYQAGWCNRTASCHHRQRFRGMVPYRLPSYPYFSMGIDQMMLFVPFAVRFTLCRFGRL